MLASQLLLCLPCAFPGHILCALICHMASQDRQSMCLPSCLNVCLPVHPSSLQLPASPCMLFESKSSLHLGWICICLPHVANSANAALVPCILTGCRYLLLLSTVALLVALDSYHALLACSAMQNLREAIAGYRGRLMHEGNDVKRNALLQVLLIVTHINQQTRHHCLETMASSWAYYSHASS